MARRVYGAEDWYVSWEGAGIAALYDRRRATRFVVARRAAGAPTWRSHDGTNNDDDDEAEQGGDSGNGGDGGDGGSGGGGDGSSGGGGGGGSGSSGGGGDDGQGGGGGSGKRKRQGEEDGQRHGSTVKRARATAGTTGDHGEGGVRRCGEG